MYPQGFRNRSDEWFKNDILLVCLFTRGYESMGMVCLKVKGSVVGIGMVYLSLECVMNT